MIGTNKGETQNERSVIKADKREVRSKKLKGCHKMKSVGATCERNLFENKIMGFRELRANISEVIDRVINRFEIIESGNIKKNNKETAVIIASKALESILAAYEFNPEKRFDETTGQHEIILGEIGISGFGDTQESAMEMLLDMVIDNTEEYFENTDLYMRISDLKAKFPYYMRIKQCQDKEELKKVLNLVHYWGVENM